VLKYRIFVQLEGTELRYIAKVSHTQETLLWMFQLTGAEIKPFLCVFPQYSLLLVVLSLEKTVNEAKRKSS
jgi:hypothetical protein